MRYSTKNNIVYLNSSTPYVQDSIETVPLHGVTSVFDSPNNDTFVSTNGVPITLGDGSDTIVFKGGNLHVYGFSIEEDYIDITYFTAYHHYSHLTQIAKEDMTTMKITFAPDAILYIHMDRYPTPDELNFIFSKSECHDLCPTCTDVECVHCRPCSKCDKTTCSACKEGYVLEND